MIAEHYAWIIGDESWVALDWQGFADYARRYSWSVRDPIGIDPG